MKPTAALLALSLMSTTASAAPLAPERAAALTRQLEAIMKDPAMPLPGLSVVAIRAGEVVYSRQLGSKRLATGDAPAWPR